MAKKTNHKTETAPLIAEPAHIRHSLPLLQLLASQLQAAIADNNRTMAELAAAHNTIATAIPPLVEKQHSKPVLQQQLHGELNRMVIAFQGHDAFNQRLEHISNALEALGRQLANGTQRDQGHAWAALTQQLSNSYTTNEERRIHMRVKGTMEEGPALSSSPGPEGGSTELF